MADFTIGLNFLDKLEGGFSDDPLDLGGATASGISLRFLKEQQVLNADINLDGTVDIKDLQALTGLERKTLFQTCFWDVLNLDKILNQRVANALFAQSVNCGPMTATKLAQNSINDMMPKPFVAADGKLGPITQAALNCRQPGPFIAHFKQQNGYFYQRIVNHNPSQKRFLLGWLRRLSQF